MRKEYWNDWQDEDVGGEFKRLGGERTRVQGDSFDATYITTYHCVAPKHLTHQQVVRAIYNAHSSDPCGHSYDCCGCWHYHASGVKRTKRRNYVFSVHAQRNY